MSFGFAVYVRFPLTKVRISEKQTKLIKFIFNCVHLFVTLHPETKELDKMDIKSSYELN